MPRPGLSFTIAGAGIAGMTLALALAKFGATVIVLERNAALQEFGAGLQISPNARHALNDLGLGEALTRVSLEPQALDIYPHGQTRPLVNMELGEIMIERFGAPYAVMHRADLANVLYKACRRFANIDILFGVRNWDVVSHANGVTVAIDEANGQTRNTRSLGFIGADGVHSRTRQAVLGGLPANFGHRIAWRTLVPQDAVDGLIGRDTVSVFFGAGFHLVCYPLPHRRQVNLALFMPGGSPDVSAEQQPRLKMPGRTVSRLLDAAGKTWTPWPLYTVRTSVWHEGNIGIMGDAAHAMVPFQAQGAAMGIEDAAILAPLLAGSKSAETALRQYSAIRQRRVYEVAELSAKNGRIFHMRWPASMARDSVLKVQGPRGHLKRLKWIYGYNPTTALPTQETA